jgi:hypothetical protein
MALTDNLKAYWKFEETSWNGTPGEIKDSSGNGIDGVRVGGANTTAGGILGRCGTFDGSGDYALLGNVTGIREHDHFSGQVWWKVPSQQATIKCALCGYDAFNFQVSYPSAGNGRFGMRGSSDWIIAPIYNSTRLDDNNWHHLVGTYDGSKMRLYVDGNEVGSGTDASGVIGSVDTTDAIHLAADYAFGIQWVGLLDEVAIWDRALTSAEVTTLYNSGAGYDMFGGGSTSIKGLISSGIIQSPR